MMRVLAFSMASVMIMFCGLPIASSETLSGSLTYTPSELDSDDGLWVTGNKWSNSTITMSWWVVTDNEYLDFPWKYTYSFVLTSDNPQGGISHLIIECSEGMSVDDIEGLTSNVVFEDTSVKLQWIDSGNPNMPEDLWGIRFELPTDDDEVFELTWSFWSNRMPVWGDFYAKDGGNNPVNTAYNYNMTGDVEKGFLSSSLDPDWPSDLDPDLPFDSDPAGLYHILRPDSRIPEPGSFVLLVTAAVGLLGCAWRRKRKYG